MIRPTGTITWHQTFYSFLANYNTFQVYIHIFGIEFCYHKISQKLAPRKNFTLCSILAFLIIAPSNYSMYVKKMYVMIMRACCYIIPVKGPIFENWSLQFTCLSQTGEYGIDKGHFNFVIEKSCLIQPYLLKSTVFLWKNK